MKITPKLILGGLMFLPWLSIPFVGKRTLKRYGLASLFISLFVRLESLLARKRTWWWFYKQLHHKLIGETPLIWGPFFVGSIWILKYSYRNYPLYLTVNALTGVVFAYPLLSFLKRMGIASVVRLKRFQLLLLFLFKAHLLYATQYVVEKVRLSRGQDELL